MNCVTVHCILRRKQRVYSMSQKIQLTKYMKCGHWVHNCCVWLKKLLLVIKNLYLADGADLFKIVNFV